MKTIVAIGAFIWLVCCGGLEMNQALAQPLPPPVTVSVRGEAPKGQDATALADGKRKAVYKVLSHIVPPSQDPASGFRQILSQYDKYVLSTKVNKKENHQDHQDWLLEVVVDVAAIQTDGRALVFDKQENHGDMPITFLLKVSGVQDEGVALSNLTNGCATSFQRLGFVSAASDAALDYIHREAGLPYEEYIKVMHHKLNTEFVDVTFAVVGQVSVSTVSADHWGVTKNAMVKARVVDLLNNVVIYDIDKSYDMRSDTEAMAEQQVLQKTALDISEILARKTLDYWDQIDVTRDANE